MDIKSKKDSLEQGARCLRVLAHPTRLLIVHLLAEGERSVTDLERQIGGSQSSMSQHLNLLRDKGILASRRAAQQVFYRLVNPRVLDLTHLVRELFCKPEVKE